MAATRVKREKRGIMPWTPILSEMAEKKLLAVSVAI
jgi:hypothetical protein